MREFLPPHALLAHEAWKPFRLPDLSFYGDTGEFTEETRAIIFAKITELVSQGRSIEEASDIVFAEVRDQFNHGMSLAYRMLEHGTHDKPSSWELENFPLKQGRLNR